MLSDLVDLFVSFARVSGFGFGGGPSMIPLLRVEVVELRGWLSPEAFLDAYAFGSSLPGPIMTKSAVYVGYHVAGWVGGVVALVATTGPTLVLLLVVMRLVANVKKNQALGAALTGVRPIIIALLLLVIWDFLPAAFGGMELRSQWPYWLIAVVSLYLGIRKGVHPIALIVGGGLAGAVIGFARLV